MSGINTAVNQLRAQLGDDSASPRYIETVIGSGYRFIADVCEVELPAKSATETLAESPPTETVDFPAEEAVGSPPVSQAQPTPASKPGRRKKIAAIAMAVSVALCAPALYLLFRTLAARRGVPRADVELARVTESGDIQFADLSPDGKYLAYVRDAGGKQLLALQQLATGRVLELATLGEDECPGLAFSSDGGYLYFARKKPQEPSGDLYRLPFLGGIPTRVLSGVSGAPAISPDGRSVAFVRSTLETHGVDSIVIAALDDSRERVLASYDAPGVHLNRISWTPDGKSLVYALQATLVSIPAEGGTAHALPGGKWVEVDDMRQLPRSDDLIVVGRLSSSASAQIFQLPLAGGEPRKITNDLSNYAEVRVAADGKTLLALQHLVLSSVQILAQGRGSENRLLHEENQNHDGLNGLAWTPQGKLVYLSELDWRREIMEVDEDGSNSRRLAESVQPAVFSHPAISPRGDFIAVVRWKGNDEANIWRMSMDGGNPTRLTNGKQDFPPAITPDGRWVVFGSVQGDHSVLMKVPSQGGPATRLTDYETDLPAVSPDGKWIACYRIPRQNQPASLAVVPLAGGPPVKVFALPATALHLSASWTPDGRAIAFVNSVNGVGNIWRQSVAGGPPAPVTHFPSGKIFNFQWSRDGRLALCRGTETTDAVLIRNFRGSAQ